MADAIDRVGLGVDLLGGNTLSQLKEIRAEMEAIANLGRGPIGGGATGGGGGGSTTGRTPGQRKRLDVEKEVSDDEVSYYIKAQERKVEIKRKADFELIQREQEDAQIRRRIAGFNQRTALAEQQELTRITIQGEEERQRALLRTRNSFSRYNSPALATQINRGLPDEIPVTTRSGIQVIRGPRVTPVINRPIRDDSDLEALRAQARASRPPISRSPEQQELLAFLEGGGDASKFVSKSELESAEITRKKGLVDRARQRREDTSYVNSQLGPPPRRGRGGGPGGGGGGGGEEDGGGGGGSGGGAGGFTGAVSRLARNFVIYKALSLVTRDLYQYISASLEAAKATSEQANALVFATEAAQGNLEANRALASQLQSAGFNRAESSGVVAAAARATFRHPEIISQFTTEAVNIAAFRGGGLKETPKVIEDIIGGRDRAYREYFNTTPEDIYKQAAQKKIAQSSAPGFIGIGNKDYDTEAQKISKYVAALTEEEKEQLRLNYVLTQAYRFQGDAAERAGTLAGKMDLVSAAFFNASANVGAFVADITPVKNLLDQIASADPSSKFNPAVLRQGGPRSTITDANVVNFAGDSVTGVRAQALTLVSKVTDIIANSVTTINSVAAIGRGLVGNELDDSPTSKYARDVAENVAKSKQVRQFQVLREQGQTGYRSLDNSGELGKYYTYPEVSALGYGPGYISKHFVEEVKPAPTSEFAIALSEYNKKRETLQQQGPGAIGTQQLNALDASYNASLIGKFAPADYTEQARKREDERKTKEDQQKRHDEQVRDDNIRQESLGLAKLRDASEGSFKLVGDIGTALTGPDNQFTKILADQITSAERMRQQWGFLGEAAVKYFDTLEQKALSRQLNTAEFTSYTKSSGLLGQAAREQDQRNDPTTLSRGDQEYLNIQEAIVERAKQIPVLWRQAAEILGRQITPGQELAGRINLLTGAFGVQGPRVRNAYGQDIANRDNQRRNVYGQPLGDFFGIQPRRNALGQSLEDPQSQLAFSNVGRGESPEVRKVLQKSFADSIIEAFRDYTPAQIRQSGYQSFYLGALQSQGNALGGNIIEARQKAEIGAREDVRLQQQLNEDAQFRSRQIAAGRDPADVGRESDKLLLSRTEGIPSKDLTLDQFAGRQEALRREAERTVKDQADAKKATEKALEYQQKMQKDIEALRRKIVDGDFKALIQVQNDTQARVDQEDLVNANEGKFSPLDQRGVKSSAYTPSTEKYKRTGGKYGLTNR